MQVIKCSHTQGAGRQLGNVQFELRDVLSRAKRPLRLRPGDSVNQVRLEERKFQFLYSEGKGGVFMRSTLLPLRICHSASTTIATASAVPMVAASATTTSLHHRLHFRRDDLQCFCPTHPSHIVDLVSHNQLHHY